MKTKDTNDLLQVAIMTLTILKITRKSLTKTSLQMMKKILHFTAEIWMGLMKKREALAVIKMKLILLMVI